MHYSSGKLWLDDRELGDCLQDPVIANSTQLGQISLRVRKFREECRNKNHGKYYSADEIEIIEALCDGYLQLIASTLSRNYEKKRDALDVTLDESGQLLLNQVNVNALIAQCKSHPNEKARIFLKGMQGRLKKVLEKNSSTGLYESLGPVISSLIREIDQIDE